MRWLPSWLPWLGPGGRDATLVCVIPQFRPMLATSGTIRGSRDLWAFELKLDGWRALVYVDADRVTVRSRTGRDITNSVPVLAGLAGVVPAGSVVLDGELVAGTGDAWSFYRLGPRMNARRPSAPSARTPVAFACFDVLWLDGDVTAKTYCERRALLEELDLRGDSWCTVPSTPDGETLFVECARRRFEGVVAKRLDSSYRPGERSSAWVKVKTPEWRSDHGPRRHER